MSYIPEHVITYYAAKHGVSITSAKTAFADLEAFLHTASNGPARPSPLVDDAWHAFLLHTKDYSNYCLQRFGSLVHHVPDFAGSGDDFADGASFSSCSSNCSNCSSRIE